MTPVNTAIWYIESHLRSALSLERVAEAAGINKFHLARSFVAATGMSVMSYVRARRMSEAAKILAAGAPDILSVALSLGYNSHEAFTRAFTDTFGVAPNQARTDGAISSLHLKEPILMDSSNNIALAEPRFEQGPELYITGLQETYEGDKSAAGIPEQWQRFMAHARNIPGQKSDVTYGVCVMNGTAFNYMCGVETSASDEPPEELTQIKLAPQRYAVFRHDGHISTIRMTWAAIFDHWLPAADVVRAEAPDFEWYSADFNPMTGAGYVEIWIPVAS